MKRLKPCSALATIVALSAPLAAYGKDTAALPRSEPVSARAVGFTIKDLSSLGPDFAKALGPDYIFRAEPRRLTLACTTCEGAPAIDVLLGTQTDGTEDRVRSGVTTIGDLERICRSRNDSCRITELNVEPAVGWQSNYAFGSSHGVTSVIILEGQMLTVRIVAGSAVVANAVTADLLPIIGTIFIAR